MRLIDADKIPYQEAEYRFSSDSDTDVDFITIKFAVDALPTVDAEPVRHGKWLTDPHSQYGFPLHIYLKRKCSECSHSVDNPTPYCPWCGAKMDAERKEE